MIKKWLLFANSDGDVYAKAALSTKETKYDKIASGFSDIVGISNLDTFIYVADRRLGLYAIEINPDGTFSDVKVVPGAGSKAWPKTGVNSMITIRMVAALGMAVGASVVSLVVCVV